MPRPRRQKKMKGGTGIGLLNPKPALNLPRPNLAGQMAGGRMMISPFPRRPKLGLPFRPLRFRPLLGRIDERIMRGGRRGGRFRYGTIPFFSP